MTAYRIVVAERKDIALVTVACEECGAAITFDPESGRVPMGCGSCGVDYTQPVKQALTALGRFHREARNAEEKAGKVIFRFEVKEPDSKAT